jgi:hypothetical protein
MVKWLQKEHAKLDRSLKALAAEQKKVSIDIVDK